MVDKLNISLKYCYGIQSLDVEFDFGDKRAVVAYAPNGMMKTSFAKTFQDYSEDEATQDRVRPHNETIRIINDQDGSAIDPGGVFVIEPYVSSYESTRISTLLANRKLKEEYDEIHKKIDSKKNDLLKKLKDVSGLKSGVEDVISVVFTKREDNLLRALDRIKGEVAEESESDLAQIKYGDIFGGKVEEFLNDADIKDKLQEYTNTYENLLDNSKFFRKGVFNHYQANEIARQLKNHGFFKAEHSVYLNAQGEEKKITSEAELETVISEEMDNILSNEDLKSSFAAIDKKLKNQDLRSFREFLLENQTIIPQLSNLELLKEAFWKAYLAQYRDAFDELMQEYEAGKKRIDEITKLASAEATKWQDVINIFNRRFSVPFKVSIENKQDVILKSVTPNVSFEFDDDNGDTVPIERNQLIDVLSNGEKRALYILNIIFEVEARKEAGIPTLFVVDDIADSFDYKNKYAIVEYLNDILNEGDFKQIILTHNYDFYRTVWKRLELGGANYQVSKNGPAIEFIKESMYRDPFEKWKKTASEGDKTDMLIAMIPFVRNIADYCGHEREVAQLTSLLHVKSDTANIKVADLARIFGEVLGGEDFVELSGSDSLVKDLIYSEADDISSQAELSAELECKVVLSIAIRLKAEEFMIEKIADADFVSAIRKNQTARLIKRYKEQYSDSDDERENTRVLERVNLMTPENIHLNSFMYEPILDMSTDHLVRLYSEVSDL